MFLLFHLMNSKLKTQFCKDRIRFSFYATFLLPPLPPVHLLQTGFQCVGSGLSLEPPATTEADEEEDGMSDIIQEVTEPSAPSARSGRLFD